MTEEIELGIFGTDSPGTLVYLPGLHGDWTLVTGFRVALSGRVRFVEVTYPRSLTWTIQDYGKAIEQSLLDRGITHGWLLAESFGSQPAWELIARNLSTPVGEKPPFEVDGLVLAGGFVKHPWERGPNVLRRIGEKTSMRAYRLEMKIYSWYSRFRRGRDAETIDSITQFVKRRTDLDRQAMRQRLLLLNQYDPRPIARQTRLPVHYLAGAIDPLVPWPLVRWWLRRNCPGYRHGKTFWLADHNVLATSPVSAADLVVKWMRG